MRDGTVRVVEIFGPTIQGEGPHAGRVTHFVRFGGCDYRCSWCDSLHAVLPELVRQADNLTDLQIVDRLDALSPAPMVVLSGGNPALQHLDTLLPLLEQRYDVIAVETQGSRWQGWLAFAHSLVVSPKPPSSGEVSKRNDKQLVNFMAAAAAAPAALALKVVVFGEEDLAWAYGVHTTYPTLPFYLSVGTDQDHPDQVDHADTVAAVGKRYAWLCERVANDPLWRDATVLPQLHVIAWGHKVGV